MHNLPSHSLEHATRSHRTGWLVLAILVTALPSSAATFTINDFGDGSDSDLGDGVCSTSGGSCTLRAAIEQANSLPGQDIVEINSDGTIVLTSVRIDITDSLILRPGLMPPPSVTITSTIQSALLRILQNGTTVTIEDLTFSNPNSQAIVVGLGPQVTIRRCVFDGNVNSSGSVSGGALSIGGETLVEDSTLRNNSSNVTNGGAIWLSTSATLTIRDSTIEDNSARYGGGIAVAGGMERLILEDTVIQRNHASFDGGGIYSQSRVESDGVTLFQNTANGDGGGIFAENRGGGNTIDALNLVGADIRDNTAVGDGGGAYLGAGAALHAFLISRSAARENDASLGGGIFVAGGTNTEIQIANSTIGLNTAAVGGGVYLFSGDLDILHSTIANNQNEQLRNLANNRANVGNSIIAFETAGSQGCDNAPTQIGPNLASDNSCGTSIVGDPKLSSFTNTGGYAPTQPFADDSPALDAADYGICSAAPIEFFDSDGPNRPQGAACDLGSWESSAGLFGDGFESGDTSAWKRSP